MRGVSCVRGFIPLAECERCALDPLHPCMFSADMLASMRGSQVDQAAEESGGFTPSRLLACDRRAGLEVGGASSAVWLDVEKAFPLLRGNMVHALMERVEAVPGTLGLVREVRFQAELPTRYGPRFFSGKPDLITVKSEEGLLTPGGERRSLLRCKVTDYKSKKKIGHGLTAASREHTMQVNMYAYLVERCLPQHLRQEVMVLVDELEVVYVDMDRVRRFTSAGELSDRGKRLSVNPLTYETLTLAPIPLLEREVVEAWVIKHVESRIKAQTEELPPPLEGDAAWVCRFCPVAEECRSLAERGV